MDETGPRMLAPQAKVPLAQRSDEQLRAEVAAARNELADARREIGRLQGRLAQNEARRLAQAPSVRVFGGVALVEFDVWLLGRISVWRMVPDAEDAEVITDA